jgi:hypothetical protein
VHCEHSILVQADGGINDWMRDAVALLSTGERIEGTYDGYGNLNPHDRSIPSRSVVVHRACWEVAGKPEFSYYAEHDLSSQYADDQGFYFHDEHDLIDPRITDGVERARLLEEGRERRVKTRFDERAQHFCLLLLDSRNEDPETAWEVWFPVFNDYEEGCFRIASRLEEDRLCDQRKFDGFDEAKRSARELWSTWVQSEEFAALKTRSDELLQQTRQRQYEKLKDEGTYKVSYKTVDGDLHAGTEGDRTEVLDPDLWKGHRRVYFVQNKLTRAVVFVADGPDKALGRETFLKQPGYRGNHSPEWEARVSALRAATSESLRIAQETADRLNAEWATAGYPMEFPGELDVERTEPSVSADFKEEVPAQ